MYIIIRWPRLVTCRVVLEIKHPDGLTLTSYYVLAYALYINNLGKAYHNGVCVQPTANAFLTYAFLSLKLNHFKWRTISFVCLTQLVLKPSGRNERCNS
jgi:hypothetical protein